MQKYNNTKKALQVVFLSSLFFLLGCNSKKTEKKVVTKAFYETIEGKYLNDLNTLKTSTTLLHNTKNLDSLRAIYPQARKHLKALEPLMAYYKSSVYKALNQPNLPTLHEDSNGIVNESPNGFQVLEEALFTETPDTTIIYQEINNINKTLDLEITNLNLSSFKNYHFLWMIRSSLIRIMSLGIVGFDSPALQNSVPETIEVLKSLQSYLALKETEFKDQSLYQNWQNLLENAIQNLNKNTDFNTFNRYSFIKNTINPALKLWKNTVKDWNVTFPFKMAINDEAESFFANNTFNVNAFKPRYAPQFSEDIAEIGKQLFFDKNLSSTKDMSCATCHAPDKYFTDGKPKAIGQNGKVLMRNSPTLYYSALQANQFYDGRVRSLENQIADVTNNKDEFHNNLAALDKAVNANAELKTQFEKHYKKGVTEKNVRNAIATYIRSLNPFNSKFDKNISGLENTLTEREINGFNLFMGKAQCATCHFAPIFNGTVPPNFRHSEFEVLGVAEKPVLKNATIDKDLGRYNLYQAKKRKFAFKTSTVRNAEKTAPYMHNGAYKTLEDVMNFYNVGGGSGIGIALDNQTLPEDPLNLTQQEINDVIAFIKSLTDQTNY